MTDYPWVRCTVPAVLEDEIGAILDGTGVIGAELQPLDDGSLRVNVYLAPGCGRPGEAAARLAQAGAFDLHRGELPESDWLEPYRKAVRAFPVGTRWWLDPRPDEPTPAPGDRVRLVVEPRTAFGSGSHESTQLVLIELEGLEIAGRKVLDVGTGNGVLAFAAERLGAAMVVALDIDPEAVWVARETAAVQERPAAPLLIAGTLDAVRAAEDFDLVMCNMVAEHMLPLTAAIAGQLRPGGLAALSGLLEEQRLEVEERLGADGLTVIARSRCGEWAAVVARRNG